MHAPETTRRAGWQRVIGRMALAFGLAVILIGCVVETPPVENTQVETTQQSTAVPDSPRFEPTAPPAPTEVPTEIPPTPVPRPTPTPTPEVAPGPEPLPTTSPADGFIPTDVDPGRVAIPVADISFVLDQQRPILQLGGHTLIYLDANQLAEVDIFSPIADAAGIPLRSYGDVINFLVTEDVFFTLEELPPVTIAGLPTRVFDATAVLDPLDSERSFITAQEGFNDELLGWFVPPVSRMWVIDAPAGPIVLSAESLENPGQFEEALALAMNILSTIEFG